MKSVDSVQQSVSLTILSFMLNVRYNQRHLSQDERKTEIQMFRLEAVE